MDLDAQQATRRQLTERGRAGDARAIDALIASLDVGPSPTQEQVGEWEYAIVDVQSIGMRAVPLLIAALTDRSRPGWVRQGAARAVGGMGDERAIEPMMGLLADETEDLDLRRMIAFSIGRLGDRRVVDRLLAIAADRDADLTLRRNALHALDELADPRSFDGLVALLRDPAVRNLATQTLRSLRDPRALAALLSTLASDDAEWRSQVAASVGSPASEPLLELLGDPDWRCREGAATALGFALDPRAVGPLARLSRDDPASQVRRAAVASLGFFDDPAVPSVLAEVLHDDGMQVRLAAMQGIYHLALQGKAPASLLPEVERVAVDDPGIIGNQYPVREAGGRAARELRRLLQAEST